MKTQENVVSEKFAKQYMSFLKFWRKSNNLTLDEAAEKLSLKTSTYFRYEEGKFEPSFYVLERISKHSGMSMSEIMFLIEHRHAVLGSLSRADDIKEISKLIKGKSNAPIGNHSLWIMRILYMLSALTTIQRINIELTLISLFSLSSRALKDKSGRWTRRENELNKALEEGKY